MEYNKNSRHYTKKVKVEGIEIGYEKASSFKKRYPQGQGGYRVLGAIGKGVCKEQGSWSKEGKQLSYYEMNYGKLRYGIKGYVEVEKDTYIAVIKEDYTKLIKILGLLIVMVSLILGMFYVLQNQEKVVLDPSARKYQTDVKMPEDMDKTRIAIPGYEDIQMDAGKKEAYIALWNPDDNPCYFKFQIVLDKGEETIYTSGLIPPGNAVTTVKFNRQLEKGIHPITIRIHTFGLDDHTKILNGGEVKTRLIALSKE